MLNPFVNLIGNFCELAILLFFLTGTFKPKVRKPIFITLCLFFTLFQFISNNFFLSQSSLVLLSSFIFTLLITLLYDIKWVYRFLIVFFIFVINGFSEIIIGMLLTTVLNVDVSFTQEIIPLFATCTITSKFLAFIFALIVKSFVSKKFLLRNGSSALKKTIVPILLLPLSSILVIMLILHCCYQINESWFHITTLVTSLILIIANIAIFFIVDKQNELIDTKEKLLFAEKHISNQIIHYKDLYNYQNELSAFKHDTKNKYISVIGLLRENSVEKVIDIFEKDLALINESTQKIINSGNPVIDAIIQSKVQTANEKNIEINTLIKCSSNINIEEFELGIILGNALDNAIEATEKIIDVSKKLIHLNIRVTEDRISVVIKNPVVNNVDTTKLTTTKADNNAHGFGIKNIQTISQKYGGLVNFECENNIFTANISLENF